MHAAFGTCSPVARNTQQMHHAVAAFGAHAISARTGALFAAHPAGAAPTATIVATLLSSTHIAHLLETPISALTHRAVQSDPFLAQFLALFPILRS